MEKEELAVGIVLYSNVIPFYEQIVPSIEDSTLLQTINWGTARVYSEDEGVVNKDSRDTSVIGVPYKTKLLEGFPYPGSTFDTTLSNLFFKYFDPLERDYIQTYSCLVDHHNSHDSYGILKYGQGQKFINHIDDSPNATRRISTVYYLNDNYTGGEINFPRFGITLKPKANQMVIFPSSFVYNHSVDPVVEGKRYAVVSWIK
jgi:hypothetical protein